MRSQRHLGNRSPHTTFQEHPVESAAGADHQENGGGRPEAVVGELEDLITREVLPVSQRPKGEEQRHEQRDDRAADEIDARAERARGVERYVGCGGAQHQDHREQHGEERDAEARHVARNAAPAARELRGDRALRGERDARCNPRGEDRARQRRRRQPDQEGIGDRASHIGVVGADREHRRRMRRHHPVHHRQPRHQRNTDLHE